MADPLAEAAGLRRLLSQGGTVLVVGARSSNFSDALRTHPRITVWDSTDPQSELRHVADNVRVIISTRFIGHTLFARLHQLARRRHLLMVPGLKNTGEIKTMLEHALGLADPPAPESPSVETVASPVETTMSRREAHHQTAKGVMRAFLIEHKVSLTGSAGQEAARLLPLAHTAGFAHANTESLRQAIYQYRYQLKKKTETEPAPAPSATPPPPQRPLLIHSTPTADAVRMIDDAVAALGLAREAVLRLQQDEKQTQDILKALRGVINDAPNF